MMRSRIDLDGAWDFLHSDRQAIRPVEIRRIQVPGPWQAQFADLRTRGGTGIYRRFVDVPKAWIRADQRILFRVGASFHNTRAWLNDVLVGAYEGGFLPFHFDVTAHIREGSNELKLRVESPSDDAAEFPGAPLAEIPFGKQSWYGPLSGLWQSVYLELCNVDSIERTRLTSDLASGFLRVRIFFGSPMLEAADLDAIVYDCAGSVIATAMDQVEAGTAETGLETLVTNVRAWSPESPTLYRLQLNLRRKAELLDMHTDYFGFRTIETKAGRLYLNGRPLYLRGALDQDYYPETICTTPSTEFLEDQFHKVKKLGLNCVRLHIKAADPRYYEVADRLGVLVWAELPNGGLSTERSRARKEQTLRGIVDRDFNHVSIIIWTIINENWGVDLVNDVEHRRWLKHTFNWLKAYDTTRLVVDNSPLDPSFHVETDIADYHFYAGYPDGREDWNRFVMELATRPAWLFSSEGDAVQTGTEPLMCSEFGNWGLPHPTDLHAPDGSEPWWFETGHDWGDGIMYPHGVEHRFLDFSLDRVFGSFRDFAIATQWQQFQGLKYAIETMRAKPTLCGYVITELTDCHWESNGLLDMRRNPRVFHEQFAAINSNIVIVPRWDRLSYWAGEMMQIEVCIAHDAGHEIKGARLAIGFDKITHFLEIADLTPAGVSHLDPVRVRVPGPSKVLRRLNFNLLASDGVPLAENYLDVAIYPQRNQPMETRFIWSPQLEARDYLASLGYSVAPSVDEADVIITSILDKALADCVRNGARLLLLPISETSLNPFFPHWQNVRVVARSGTLWRGEWASTFAWLRRGQMFGHIPGGPLIDATFDRVIPNYVIAGCNLHDFQGRVYSGLVIGWIHKAVALIVERPYGRGHVVVSTFRLFREPPGVDPTATALIDTLIEVACAPVRHTQGLDSEVAPTL